MLTTTITTETYDGADHLTVTAWEYDMGLDRPHVAAWSFQLRDRALAERLVKAIKAGVILTDAEVKHDVNGKTYLATNSSILARMMNAELRRLGF